MGSTGHVVRDPLFDSSQSLIAQLLLVQRRRGQRRAPGPSSRGQGFQNPCCNVGLSLRKSIHQIVEPFSRGDFHGPNLAHPSRPDPMVPEGQRRRRTAGNQRVTLRRREAAPARALARFKNWDVSPRGQGQGRKRKTAVSDSLLGRSTPKQVLHRDRVRPERPRSRVLVHQRSGVRQ